VAALVVSVFAVSIVAGRSRLGNTLRAGTQPAAATTAREPITIETTGHLDDVAPEERVRTAPLIVQGVVGQPDPSRWNTPTGELPQGATAENVDMDSVIFTDYPITVERILKGSVESATVRVRTLGGSVGQDAYKNNGAPTLAAGQRVILLLKPDGLPSTRNVGPQHYSTVHGIRGVYKIVGNQSITRDYNEEASPERGMPLADLLALIRASGQLQPAATAISAEPTP